MSGDEGETPDDGTNGPDPDETAEETAADPDEPVDEGAGGGDDASVDDVPDSREPTDPHVDDGSGQQPPEEAVDDQASGNETLADDVDDQRATDQATEPSDSTAGSSSGQVDSSGANGGQVETTAETNQGESVETTVVREGNQDGDSLLAALISFVIPGLGNMLNGQIERGLIILVLWILWLIVGWGIGFFLIGSFITLITLGIGVIFWMVIGLVVGAIEFAIHVVAAIDAYRQSELVDNVTVKVNEVRGN